MKAGSTSSAAALLRRGRVGGGFSAPEGDQPRQVKRGPGRSQCERAAYAQRRRHCQHRQQGGRAIHEAGADGGNQRRRDFQFEWGHRRWQVGACSGLRESNDCCPRRAGAGLSGARPFSTPSFCERGASMTPAKSRPWTTRPPERRLDNGCPSQCCHAQRQPSLHVQIFTTSPSPYESELHLT